MFGINGNVVGLLNSAGTILDSGLGLLQSRVELFSAELQQERKRFFQTMLFAAALVTLGIFTLALFTVTVVLAFWEGARLAALSGLTLLYLSGTILLYRRLNQRFQKGRPLSGTIDELKRDRESLGAIGKR